MSQLKELVFGHVRGREGRLERVERRWGRVCSGVLSWGAATNFPGSWLRTHQELGVD